MEAIQVVRLEKLDEGAIAHLIDESSSQGFRFVRRLLQEYRSGVNCFDRQGEALFAALINAETIGIGGLNQDPYFNDSNVGRLRHLYVGSSWRRQGIGRLLTERIIHEARQHYRLLTLRTDTLEADRFYQKLGFKTQQNWKHTTHYLQLSSVSYYPELLLKEQNF